MEATIEQIHRMNTMNVKQREGHLGQIDKFAKDGLANKSCEVKEFRFPPPYVGKKKKPKKLPPLQESMPQMQDILSSNPEVPKRHNTEEDLTNLDMHELPPILNIDHTTEALKDTDSEPAEFKKLDMPSITLFQQREFTFPMTPKESKAGTTSPGRVKEMPLHVRLEKLARKRRKGKNIKNRKESKGRSTEMVKFPDIKIVKRKGEHHSLGNVKHYSFKQMSKTEDPHAQIPPRLYTKIVDSIYTYSRGLHFDMEAAKIIRKQHLERLPGTPVTTAEERNEIMKTSTVLPPIT
ncbi:hypothetical protein ACJMK2_026577 [Sinanodonta woodiana]|uniref:Uncharacterized protein n=1 Tax=Sinanodonta woodiana TaxID=1069815 RepID=A0ABD3XMC6_SINWO